MDATKMDGLAGLVEEVDGTAPAAQAAAAEQAKAEALAIGEAEAWAVIPTTIGKLACMVVPELSVVYTEASCKEWGQSMVPVAAKYGWGGPSALPELALAISTAGFAVPTFLAVRMRLAQLKAATKAAEAPAPAPKIDTQGTTATPPTGGALGTVDGS